MMRGGIYWCNISVMVDCMGWNKKRVTNLNVDNLFES